MSHNGNKTVTEIPNISVAHSLPGRIRLNVPGLKGNRLMADTLASRVKLIEAVRYIKASPLTGRLLVEYDGSRLREKELLEKIVRTIVRPVTAVNRRAEHSREFNRGIWQEPEDLPIKKQLFNVLLGGGVLAGMGLKHLLKGRTPLARHPHIFNLAAVTAIVSGYPVFRSGLEGLSRGKINYDLVISALALGTTLVRESVPGLMVIWLANLTALGQSLVLKGYRSALPQMPEMAGEPVQRAENSEIPRWVEAGREYSQKAVLPTVGLASLPVLKNGSGGFQKTLSMLLAANPSPAGLAAPTAATASMVKSGRMGILYRDSRTLEILSKVDTIIFDGRGALPEVSYEVGDVLPMPGFNRTGLLELAAAASCPGDNFYGRLLLKTLHERRQRVKTGVGVPGARGAAIVGDEKTLLSAGVETRWAMFKARRLQHLGQTPVYVAFGGGLAGMVGVRQRKEEEIRVLFNRLRLRGIKNILVIADEESVDVTSIRNAGAEYVNCKSAGDNVGLVQNIKRKGQKVAVFFGDSCDAGVLNASDVAICAAAKLKCGAYDVVVANHHLLPDVFGMAFLGEQRARQNLSLVQAANALGLALGATGKLPPMMAKVYNNFISVAVGVNSFRLLSSRRYPDSKTIKEVEHEIAAALDCSVNSPLTMNRDNLDSGMNSHWHSMTADEALLRLKSDLAKGLDKEQVQYLLKVFGRNKISEEKPVGLLSRMRGQFKDFLVKALMVSALVCAVLGEFADALAIVAILTVNAILGALQEHKAEGALQALSEITAPTAKVRRSGKVDRVPADQLVPGDIVLLEQGDGVPADLRIIEASCLEIEESSLTGESYPVPKSAGHISDCIPLLNCPNLAFMGTNVTRGRGVGVITATGMSTEIGKIAEMINRQERPPTPLQRRMTEVGGIILKYCLAVSAMVVLAGFLRGGSPFGMFLTGVSLAVAAIPEGLPAVVTIALASGVRRMAKENAVVKNLPAVETLGNVTLICTDKTGTLTRNRQIVQRVYTANGFWQAGAGGDKPLEPYSGECHPGDLGFLITAGILCNDAELRWSNSKPRKITGPEWRVEGDPTEGALLLAALGNKTNYKEVRGKWVRIKEIPFDAERLRMTVICRHNDHGNVTFVKGAPEVVLDLCSHILVKGEKEPLNEFKRRQILSINGEMTRDAMRVLAVAYRNLDSPDDGNPEDSLTFLGLVGMVDPVRPEVVRAVAVSRRAGIKVAMITGDHPYTAMAVAQKVGITPGNKVLTGQDIDRLNDRELAEAVREVRVFARVLPAQKLRLVKIFKQHGEVVAMIGDGINDAPAVREADIGVAMGTSGTDVTKQAADIIVTDDNFATLLPAVEQGRGIYNNIRRSVRYLLSTNVGLVFLVFTAVLFGLPVPLIPLQLLFLNVLGDGLPALALGVEPPARDLMDRPPRPADEKFFADSLGSQIISRGLATGLVGLETYHRLLKQGDLFRARTVAMATFVVSKLLFALECGEKKDSSNRYLTGSVALSAALLGGAIYLPYGRRVFKTVPLGMKDVVSVLGASGLTFILERVITSLLQGFETKAPAEQK